MKNRIKTFSEFYEFYVTQHAHPMTKVLHFLGIIFTFWVLIYIYNSGQERFFWYLPITLLLLPFLSHYMFEKKSPTGLKYPFWTLIADFRHFFEHLFGVRSFRERTNEEIAE